MFVEISGDFLVFFSRKKGEKKFLYWLSSGCSVITLRSLCCDLSFFAALLSDNVFRSSYLFQLQRGCLPVGCVWLCVGAYSDGT